MHQCDKTQWDSGNFLMLEMPPWRQKHSCQQCLCKDAILAVTNPEEKLKLLLHCTHKMYFFITDHIRLFCTHSRIRFKFSP